MSEHVYIVIRDTYGAISYPKAIHTTESEAIQTAIDLSGAPDIEWSPTHSDSYRALGHIKNGTSMWEVHKMPVGGLLERYLDTGDHGEKAP